MASPQMLYGRTQRCAVSLAHQLRAVATAFHPLRNIIIIIIIIKIIYIYIYIYIYPQTRVSGLISVAWVNE